MILYVFCIVTYSNYRYLMINEDFWLLHEIYEIAIMIIIAWHVSIGALWRLSQACCLGFPLSSKGLTASGLQLVSAFNTRDVSHLSTEKCRRFESCEQERNCQYIPIRRNILWAEARSLSQAATHSSPQKRKVRRYLPFKWCTGKLMEASYFAPMPHKLTGTYWNRTDPNNIQQYLTKDFLLQVFHLYTMHRRFLRYLESRQGHCAEERSRCQAACKSRNASCPRCTGSVATLLAWQLDENKSSTEVSEPPGLLLGPKRIETQSTEVSWVLYQFYWLEKDSQFKGCSMFPTESVCKIPRTRMESFTLHRTSQPFPHSHPVTNDSKKTGNWFWKFGHTSRK